VALSSAPQEGRPRALSVVHLRAGGLRGGPSALAEIAVYFGAYGIHETLGTGVDGPRRRGWRSRSLDAAFLIALVKDKPLFGVVTLRAHVSVMLETGHKLTSSVTVIRIISAPQAIQRILAAPLLSNEIQQASASVCWS
jgi:hypothetical protein